MKRPDKFHPAGLRRKRTPGLRWPLAATLSLVAGPALASESTPEREPALATEPAALSEPTRVGYFGLASGWEITPRVTASAELTDNATLAPRGQASSDLILSVRPGISLRQQGPSMETRVDYSLNARRFVSTSREDRTTHFLRASNDWEIVPNTFFLQTRASRTEDAASLLGPVGIGSSTPRANLQESTRYSISPLLRTRFGSFANQQIRYTYDEIRYHRSQRPNNDSHRVEYTLDSGAAFNRPFWQLAAFYEQENFEDGLEGEFGEVSATLGYRFGRSLRLFGTAGREFNDFATTREDDDGSFWEVGAGWAPTRVTSIDARYGDRFFGKTRALSVEHRSRRSTYRLSYNEGIGSTRQRRGAQFDALADELGTTVDDLFDQFTLDEIAFLLAVSGLTEEALVEDFFFSQSLRGAWRYNTGRSVFGVTAFRTQRESETRSGLGLFQDNNRRTGVNASWDWQYGPLTTLDLSAGYTRTQFLGSDREDDRWNLRIGFAQELSPDLRFRLVYRHQRRDSDSAANEFRENSIIATLTKEF